MINNTNSSMQKVYYQMNTKNESFLELHRYLSDIGIKNNKFFLALLDPDLMNVDPHDPRLNSMMKQKILKECINNYFYFLREVIRIPVQGGTAGSGIRYKLNRGNLALNFCLIMNWNCFAEFPRQTGKTISVICRLLWVFLFGTSNSELMFINKKFDDSKLNLARLKEIRDALPSYLRFDSVYGENGKILKSKSNVESLEHPLNRNKIKTLPSARNKASANSLGRGCTQPIQWYDEYAFLKYNKLVYLSATPAFKTASMNARSNGAPYGIIITTTPGDLTTDEGMDAFMLKENATVFSENWYDMSASMLNELLSKNTNSSFVYIRFTYQQLGRSEQWFKEMVIDMNKDWSAIRREVLLEWSKASDNSPFSKEDLNIVKALIKEPKRVMNICGYYQFNIYEEFNPKYPPLIGVDVSGGFHKDSSAITIVDSLTTKVCADLNCNYINTLDLARVIYELVTKYMNNAVVNIERNGGFGASVIAKLLETSVKKNLYYEIKDRVIEERFNGMKAVKKTQKTKVYGLDSTKQTRELLMDILRQRMEYHKDKFISPIIFRELETLEVKKSGRIEHSTTGHDDQVFSYLLALYIWYEGTDLMERWGIQKKSIKTDQDLEEAIIDIEEKYDKIPMELERIVDKAEDPTNLAQQLEFLASDKTIPYENYVLSEREKENQMLMNMINNPLVKKAYAEKYNIPLEELGNGEGTFTFTPEIFENFYN